MKVQVPSRPLSAVVGRVTDARRRDTWLGRAAPSSLFVNSMYLVAGPVTTSLLGFLFWILAARVANPADIGIAAAAIAAVGLLMALGDFGLSTAIVHFGSADRARLAEYVNTSTGLGWPLILVASLLFLVGIPVWAPGLIPLRIDLAFAGLFLAYALFTNVLALQDAAMVALGRADSVLWRTLACNIPSVLLVVPAVLAGGGALGIFAAYGGPNIVVGLVIGLVVLPRMVDGYRMAGVVRSAIVARMASYGLANHLGNILWGVPSYVMPLIAINLSGANVTGYFYIAWAIANLVLTVPRMVTIALFAEASRPGADLRSLWRHGLLAILVPGAPALVLLWIRGDVVLGLFGADYVNEGLLRILLASAIPFSLSSIWFAWLRAQRRLTSLVGFAALAGGTVVVSASVLGLWLGVEGIALGWLAGQTVTAVVAVIGLARTLRASPSTAS